MKNKRNIAMRCNKEQFEAIKPKLEGKVRFNLISVTRFDEYNYLVNCYEGMISNVHEYGFNNVWRHVDEKQEEWNEKIFLDAFVIEIIPTLEEVKERFKDAETVKSLLTGKEDTITGDYELHFGDWHIKGSDREIEVWNKERGYAKIISYKTPKFEITKEQILELYNTGNPQPTIRKMFPEVFKPVLEAGKWYKSDAGGLWFVEEFKYGIKTQTSYGINKYGDWQDRSYTRNSTGLIEATTEEVTEALTKEAVKRGYKNGVWIVDIYKGKTKEDIIQVSSDFFDYEKIGAGVNKGKMSLRDSDGSIIFFNGIWATVIPTKTKEEAEKLLNCKIV